MQTAGQSLCLNCGMCCEGTIFSYVPLHATEPVEELRQVGLPIEQRIEGFRLLLPCSAFRNGKCQTYGFRPKNCSGYRCRLLHKVETRKTTLTNAKRTLESALRMRSHLQHLLGKHFPELGDSPPIVNSIKLIGERMDGLTAEQKRRFRLTHSEVLLAYAAFDSYLQTHFQRKNYVDTKTLPPT